MTFEEASDYMLQLNKRGIKPGLEAIRALCDVLNNPQDNLKYIQVAGTNGKGSTASFISSILRTQGYKVGVFSSPCVFDSMEFASVNGRNITKKEYTSYVETIMKLNTFGLTRFEVETVLSFMYFADKKCDIVVLEAGMGGLLDSTNIVKSTLVSVITSIGMDHMQFLGDSLEEIAINKAGIIKKDSVAISYEQSESVDNIIDKASKLNNSKYIRLSKRDIKNIRYKADITSFNYKDINGIEISLLGTYQPENACLAIEAVKALNIYGIFVSDKSIIKGLRVAREAGRFEKISAKPLIYIDGAHNLPAALRLKETIETYFTKKKIVYIMGMFKDKAVENVVSLMAPLASNIITVTLPNKERSLTAYELADIVSKTNPMVSAADSIYEAVEIASLMSSKDTVILAFGSLSHLQEVKKAVSNISLKTSIGI